MIFSNERPDRKEARTGRIGFDRPQDSARLPFEQGRRTLCPSCGSRRGFAPLIGDAAAGYCHQCKKFIPPAKDGNATDFQRTTPPRTKPAKDRPPSPELLESTPWATVSTYPYWNERGVLLYSVIRRERLNRYGDNPTVWRKEKTFCQCPAGLDRPTPGCMQGVRMVLYELTSILSATQQGGRVVVVEGEKDADTLNLLFRHELGSLDRATTSPGGAGKWKGEYSETLRGADVIIWPDNDGPGRRHGEAVRDSLRGVARSIAMVDSGRDKPTLLPQVQGGSDGK